MSGAPPRLQAEIARLPAGLRHHLLRVRDGALDLAKAHGIDTTKVELAALAHDLFRAVPDGELLTQARTAGLPVHPVEETVPVLLHGPLAAHWLEHQCGVRDTEVLEAVRWHSTGHPGMSPVELVVFLADKLDPEKAKDLQRIGKLARQSLEQAATEYLTEEITGLLAQGHLVHPASVEARNDLLVRCGNPATKKVGNR